MRLLVPLLVLILLLQLANAGGRGRGGGKRGGASKKPPDIEIPTDDEEPPIMDAPSSGDVYTPSRSELRLGPGPSRPRTRRTGAVSSSAGSTASSSQAGGTSAPAGLSQAAPNGTVSQLPPLINPLSLANPVYSETVARPATPESVGRQHLALNRAPPNLNLYLRAATAPTVPDYEPVDRELDRTLHRHFIFNDNARAQRFDELIRIVNINLRRLESETNAHFLLLVGRPEDSPSRPNTDLASSLTSRVIESRDDLAEVARRLLTEFRRTIARSRRTEHQEFLQQGRSEVAIMQQRTEAHNAAQEGTQPAAPAARAGPMTARPHAAGPAAAVGRGTAADTAGAGAIGLAARPAAGSATGPAARPANRPAAAPADPNIAHRTAESAHAAAGAADVTTPMKRKRSPSDVQQPVQIKRERQSPDLSLGVMRGDVVDLTGSPDAVPDETGRASSSTSKGKGKATSEAQPAAPPVEEEQNVNLPRAGSSHPQAFPAANIRSHSRATSVMSTSDLEGDELSALERARIRSLKTARREEARRLQEQREREQPHASTSSFRRDDVTPRPNRARLALTTQLPADVTAFLREISVPDRRWMGIEQIWLSFPSREYGRELQDLVDRIDLEIDEEEVECLALLLTRNPPARHA